MKNTTRTLLIVFASILLAPVALFEYLLLFWVWGGDGVFMLLAVPVFFLIFLLAQLYFCIRYKEKQLLKLVLIYSMILITPVLAVGASYALAWLCGIPIIIW